MSSLIFQPVKWLHNPFTIFSYSKDMKREARMKTLTFVWLIATVLAATACVPKDNAAESAAPAAKISAGNKTALIEPNYVQSVLDAKPTSYWRLQDANSVMSDEMGLNQGSYYQAPNMSLKGPLNVLINELSIGFFNQSYAQVPDSDSLNIGNRGGTLEFFIFPESLDEGTFLDLGSLALRFSNQALWIDNFDASGSLTKTTQFAGLLKANKWSYVSLQIKNTYNTPDFTYGFKGYNEDGDVFGTGGNQSIPNFGGTNSGLYIGRPLVIQDSDKDYFKGQMAEVAFYQGMVGIHGSAELLK